MRGRLATALLAATALAVSLLTPLTPLAPAAPAAAANGADFNPGNIISDAVFYDADAMSVDQIQSFLTARGAGCTDNSLPCLKSFRMDTQAKAGEAGLCAAYPGKGNQTAAQIIFDVAALCGINPRVLMVLLEKEQSLITRRSPSAYAYNYATGWCVTDSGSCVGSHTGLFNQLYMGARQFKMYAKYPTSYSYRAGRTNTILWHPNSACGSSQVFIENQATAGLYIYTPYRPNQAALANMYGVGDGCSAYGNRNFWRMYTDWFGSTTGGGYFVKTATSGTVYLLTGAVKHHVPDPATLSLFSVLGPIRVVTQSYLDYFPTGLPVAPVIKDPLSGEVSLIQDGKRHRFSSCTQIAVFGYSCAQDIDLMPSQLDKLPPGEPVGQFAKTADGAIYRIDGATKTWFETAAAATMATGGVLPFTALMTDAAAAKLPTGSSHLTPGALVKKYSDPAVFLIDGWNRKVHLTSYDITAEMGIQGTARVVNDAVLDAYGQAPSPLSLLVKCGSAYYLASAGKLVQIADGDVTGIPVTELDGTTCSVLAKAGLITRNVYVRDGGSGQLYMLTQGAARPINALSTAVKLNNGATPVITPLSSGAVATLPKGGALLAPASVVKASGRKEVYVIDGFARKIHLPNWGTADSLGLGALRTVSGATIDSYPTKPEALTQVVSCSGVQYFGAAGSLVPVAPGVSGIPVTFLSKSTCQQLKRSTRTPLSHVFVRDASKPQVYEIVGGVRQPVLNPADLVARNGGPGAVVLKIGARQLASIPQAS